MSYTVVAPESVPRERGTHPAASPFDRRVGEALGISAFGLFRVDLPPDESTVSHDHTEDQVEDVYVVLDGAGWVVIDGTDVALDAGELIAVDPRATRFVRAGPRGMDFLAICAPRRTSEPTQRGGLAAASGRVLRTVRSVVTRLTRRPRPGARSVRRGGGR
ncbi:MAG: hypothetical protein QM747_21320 [Nocardioides sp.]